MIQLFLLLVLAALLLLALFLFARPAAKSEAGAIELIDASRALNSLQTDLLPPEMVARIFASEDLDYISSSASEEIRRIFLEERKRIALSWVSYLRQNVLSLRRFHLGSARLYAGLNFRSEVTLMVDFAFLLFACRALEIVLWMRGPYGASRMVRATTAGATRVCQISERSLGMLRSGSAFGNPSAENRVTF